MSFAQIKSIAGFIGLLHVMLLFTYPVHAQVHDCTLATAENRLNDAVVILTWTNPHNRCILVSPGTTITWNGDFTSHPLRGGVSPQTDNSNPISAAQAAGGSVVLNTVGDYPYFCNIHNGTMNGVIYVRATLPGSFSKSNPANNATNQSNSPTLSWAGSSNAASYEYCIDTSVNSSCNASWISTGTQTSVNLGSLASGVTHQWQVRAVNSNGTTLANSNTWWQFTTTPALPAGFSKTSPADLATSQSTSPSLNWATSAGSDSYEYCIDTSVNSSCNATWISTGVNANASLVGLVNGTTYQWQSRAVNAAGNTEANSGTWWQFTTIPLPPGAFGKSSPANSATDQSTAATLMWSSSNGASSYEYCMDTSDNNSCDASWTSNGVNTSAAPKDLVVLTTYYWQVRAINSGGTTLADSNTWWHFTTSAVAEIVHIDGFESVTP